MEDLSELETLKQRQKQRQLFGERSTTQQGFKIINSRREESIIERLDENAKEMEEVKTQAERLNITSISKEQSCINKSLKISEREELNYKNILNDSQVIHSSKRHEVGKLDYLSANNSFLNESKQSQYKVEINLTSQQQLDKDNSELPTKKKFPEEPVVSSQHEPHFQVVMRIKKQMGIYISKYTLFGRKVNLENTQVRSLVNDLSDFWEASSDYSFTSIKTQLYMFFHKLFTKYKLNNIRVFSYQDNFILIFKILTTIINYYFMAYISVMLVFNLRYSEQYTETLVSNYFSLQWIIEIILKLNCAIQRKTDFIDQRSQIFSIYFKTLFSFDVIPIIALQLTFNDTFSWQYFTVKSFIFVKFHPIQNDLKVVQKQLVIITRKHYIVQIINLILNLFFLGHIIACMWRVLGIIDSTYFDNVNSWVVTSFASNDGVWWKVYIQAFYWSFTLMATGSNIATSDLEMYFISIVMPFTTIIFGYMINTIGIILSEIDLQSEQRRKDINIINTFMDRKGICHDLQARVNLDLEYFYQKNFKKIQEDEESVLNKISDQLNRQLKYEYNMGVFKRMKNLYDNFSFDTLTELCYVAQEITFSPNQTIFIENQTTDSCLMYIISGRVQIIQQVLQKTIYQEEVNDQEGEIPIQQNKEKYNSRILGYLKEGQTFGDLNFFTGLGRSATIKSSSFTRILKIPRDSFMEIVKNNNKDIERYCEIRDKISLYSDYSDLKFGCSICTKNDHLNNFCPNAHFDKKSPFIYARINYSNSQVRDSEYKRKRVQYKHFFSKLEHVQNQARDAQEQFITQMDEKTEYAQDEYFYEDEEEEDDEDDEQKSLRSDLILSQKSIPMSQKNQQQLQAQQQSQIIDRVNIIEKCDIQDTEKQKSSFLIAIETNKQEENMKRNSYFQKDDPQQSGSRLDTLLEPRKRNTHTKLSTIISEEYTKRLSHITNNKDDLTAVQIQKGEGQKDEMRKKSQYQQYFSFLNNGEERRSTLHQQLLYNNTAINSNFSVQKNKIDVSYSNYNKSDEIVKDIILWNLDRQKNFSYYFANGNFKCVLSKYLNIRKRQQTKQGQGQKDIKDVRSNIMKFKTPNSKRFF